MVIDSGKRLKPILSNKTKTAEYSTDIKKKLESLLFFRRITIG